MAHVSNVHALIQIGINYMRIINKHLDKFEQYEIDEYHQKRKRAINMGKKYFKRFPFGVICHWSNLMEVLRPMISVLRNLGIPINGNEFTTPGVIKKYLNNETLMEKYAEIDAMNSCEA